MAISFVGAQGNTGTTVTIPTHQAGDLILLFAYKDGSATSIGTPTAGGTVPSWISINFGGSSLNSTNFRYAVATASNTTSGTWSTATEIFCLVYRGTKAIGASAAANNTTNVISYPELTLNRANGTSWVVGVAGHRSATNVEQAPTGMTNRVSSGTEAAGHDTDGTVSSWSTQTVTVNASSGWRSVTVELRDASLALSAEPGNYSLAGQNATLTKSVAPNNYALPVDAGSFALTGGDAVLTQAKKLSVDTGAFNLTGNDVVLTKTAESELNVSIGTFNLTGNNVALTKAYALAPAIGAYALTGYDSSITRERTTFAEVGIFAFTGLPSDLQLSKTYNINSDAGVFSLIGLPVDIEYEQRRRVVFAF